MSIEAKYLHYHQPRLTMGSHSFYFPIQISYPVRTNDNAHSSVHHLTWDPNNITLSFRNLYKPRLPFVECSKSSLRLPAFSLQMRSMIVRQNMAPRLSTQQTKSHNSRGNAGKTRWMRFSIIRDSTLPVILRSLRNGKAGVALSVVPPKDLQPRQ